MFYIHFQISCSKRKKTPASRDFGIHHGEKKRGHLGLIKVAVKGGGGAGSRVEVVVVLLAPLSVERGGGREGLGVGGVRGMVQLLPTSVFLLLPTRVVGSRSARRWLPLVLLLVAASERGATASAEVARHGNAAWRRRPRRRRGARGGRRPHPWRRRCRPGAEEAASPRLRWRRHRGEAHREGKARRRRRD